MKKNQIKVEKKGNKKQKQGNQSLMNKTEKYTTEFDFEVLKSFFLKIIKVHQIVRRILLV